MDFSILEVDEINIDKFRITEILYEILFTNVERTFEEAVQIVKDMVNKLVEALRSKMSDSDKISINFFHTQFQQPISIPFIRKKAFTNELVMYHLLQVTQSYKDLAVNPSNSLNARAQIQKIPSGGGRRPIPESEKKKYVKKADRMKNQFTFSNNRKLLPKISNPENNIQKIAFYLAPKTTFSDLQNSLEKKRSVIKIINNDNYCALRSILTVKMHLDLKNKLINELFNKHEFETNLKNVIDKLKLPNKPIGVTEIVQIERFLKFYSITIYDGENNVFNNKYIYTGPPNKYFIYILYTKSHYNALLSMLAFLDKCYFCDYCKSGYDHSTGHSCKYTCKSCKRQDCTKTESTLKCKKCNEKATGLECLRIHQEKICDKKIFCNFCNNVYIKNKHVCNNQKFCLHCRKVVDTSHFCFLAPDKFPQKSSKNLIFFDYETYQEHGKHIPNLIVAKLVCIKCLDKLENKPCYCESVAFRNNFDFCQWIFGKKNSIAIAHNFRGYDGLFIVEYILQTLTQFDKMPNVLLNGSKILSIEFKGLKFIDSLSFIPMPLEKFTKTFDLKELKKGFWCYDFNSAKNQNYIGEMPDKIYYGINFMTKEKKERFDKFYEENKKKIFNFEKECLSYCTSDVDLLMRGCLSFRENMKKITISEKFPSGIDPFTSAITVGSLSNFIFKNLMLDLNTIAIIPEEGYSNPNHSKKSIQWLEYLTKSESRNIKHARNGQEVKVGEFYVDGMEQETNRVYQFYGCYFHGCDICYKPSTFNSLKQITMYSIKKQHDNKHQKLKNTKFNDKPIELLSIWEHQWDSMLKNDEKIRDFVNSFELIDKLKPRDAFFGGRTESFILHFEASSHQKIKYYDFCSLYPFIQKTEMLPTGHPKIITSDFTDLEDYFGLIKCKVLAPRGLDYPVLPIRSQNRLVFALCKKCADDRIYNCKHDDNERQFTGTWVTEEVKEAVKQGYKIIKIHEVWHFENKSNNLFKKYIDTFLKGKQECSGWPDGVVTEEQKYKYIEDYFKHEGILLDFDKIMDNPALRALLKILLNNLWGKLTQKPNKTKYKIINDSNDWIKLVSDDKFSVIRADYTNSKYLQVFYKDNEEITESTSKSNVVLGAFITAYGRLKLLGEMNKLRRRVIYVDTDSIFFWTEDGLTEPKTGP